MKKVLVLVGLMSLVATSAFAVIAGGPHDMTTRSAGATNTETCVYCHTPHAAGTELPLWNRTATANAMVVYTSPSVNNGATPATLAASDAGMCMSCHDGASDANLVTNQPKSGLALGTVITFTNTSADLSSDMSNDHPIGFIYEDAGIVAADLELEIVANVEGAAGFNFPVLSFGVGSNEMWCSSCHDVHDETNAPFLRMSNANSAMCLVCHLK